MSDHLSNLISLLSSGDHRALLSQGLRGIERETLRVTSAGALAQTPHPRVLGSALKHAEITTDYSESLLEFITPAEHDIATALVELDLIHRYASAEMGDELLWSQSMPCVLPQEQDIPIAEYGKSHIGMLKHVYRQGLALRYGRAMQCIAGIHYNFSVADGIWQLLQQECRANTGRSQLSAKDYQSESYIGMIRNFHRYSWLLMYLFGASPAVAAHFLHGRPHKLQTFSPDTLYLPYATSLRMSDLGYQNSAQAGLMCPYNSLTDYMKSLARAVRQPYAPYERLGIKRDGKWVQINANLLQVENEFYATIRPKRVIKPAERPLEALCARGVQYIEVRCMDIDPFEPTGISLQTSRFLDAFLMFLALQPSPFSNSAQADENHDNFTLAVNEGRRPGLQLQRHGQAIGLQDWGLELLDLIAPVAEMLDQQRGDHVHAQALQAQRDKLLTPALTPSARAIAAMHEHGDSFTRFAMHQSRSHAEDFRSRPLSAEQHARFVGMAEQSLAEQQALEDTQTGDFDSFITDYRSRTPSHLCGNEVEAMSG